MRASVTYEDFLKVLEFLADCSKSGKIEEDKLSNLFPHIISLCRLLTSILLLYSSTEKLTVKDSFDEIVEMDKSMVGAFQDFDTENDILLDTSKNISRA